MVNLRDKCKDAALALLGEKGEPLEGQGPAIEAFADTLSNGIVDWLTEQTFTITELKAALRVDSIKTQGPLQADVLPGVPVTTNPGQPVVVVPTMMGYPGSTTSTGTAQTGPLTGKEGVLIPKLDYSSKGGQGGLLSTTGFAYIGPNPTGITNETKTKVKLLKNNVTGI